MVKEIFVYGTLMRGGSHGELLSRRDLRLLGPARCQGSLFDLGDYPGLLPGARSWVAGELYRCEAVQHILGVLDALEMESPLKRKVIEVSWANGPTEAWAYVLTGPLQGAEPIRGGSYRAHLRRRRRKG
jgi:gamma-glutamylcyclotransferase (GGCT)/AIG2-like uncharacterized protein YtfP